MLVKEYTEAFGVSGCEHEIRKIIKERVMPYGKISIDSLGNLYVQKGDGKKKVMIAAHMDEVGFIVTKIKDDGRIIFSCIGGIDPGILVSKRVRFEKGSILGVIGSKPIHLQTKDEAKSPVKMKELFIDIGASNKEETERLLEIGDYAVFDSGYVEMGGFIKSKALDDRIGCAVVTEVLEDEYDLDLNCVFTVQEEVGLRGAAAAAFSVEPEIALIIEGTTCVDTTGDDMGYVTKLGNGPALSLMDGTSFTNRYLLKRIINVAEDNGIPYQFRRGKIGGNDAGRIHRAKEGSITASISVPTRYIHSPVSVICWEDYENTVKLVKLVLKSLEKEEL